MSVIPGVRAVLRNLRAYNVSRVLALLTERSVPLPDALRIAGVCGAEARLEAACRNTARMAETGDFAGLEISNAWNDDQLPPLLAMNLKQSDSEAAPLPRRLNGTTAWYRRRLEDSISVLQNFVPGGMTLVIGGGLTLLFALSVFWPLVELYAALGTEVFTGQMPTTGAASR